jgi:hypothetical protein
VKIKKMGGKTIALCIALLIIICLIIYLIYQHEGFMSPDERAKVIMDKPTILNDYSTYKKHLPDSDAIEYMDLKKINKSDKFTMANVRSMLY